LLASTAQHRKLVDHGWQCYCAARVPTVEPFERRMSVAMNKKLKLKTKLVNKNAVRSLSSAQRDVRESARELWLASLGAAARVRTQGEHMFGNLISSSKSLRKDAKKFVGNVADDVQEQTNGLIAQVKGATSANFNWVGEKVEASVGKVLSRLGVPSKSEVQELSRRVSDLQKQVKAMKKAA
jgi:poly(hydroxyalkanoate) granule-associated protein